MEIIRLDIRVDHQIYVLILIRMEMVLINSRSNREVKERGYYSELATINPDLTFQVNLTK